MLGTLKNKKSLTFYGLNSFKLYSDKKEANIKRFDFIPNLSAYTGAVTLSITGKYNKEINNYIESMRKIQVILNEKARIHISNIKREINNPTAKQLRYQSTWGRVKLEILRNDLMNLKLTRKINLPLSNKLKEKIFNIIKDQDITNMTLKQLKEIKKIINKEIVYEVHHGQSISSNAYEQNNFDNLEILEKEYHRNIRHGGNTRNPTNEPFIDRKSKIKQGNKKRVFKNELKGLGLTVAIALGIGITINFAISLAQSGVNNEKIKEAMLNSSEGIGEIGVLTAVDYITGRIIGESLANSLKDIIEYLGINMTENIDKICQLSGVGIITLVVFSTYNYIKLRKRGLSKRESLYQVGKQAVPSLSILVISLLAQAIYGGSAGYIVGASLGLIFLVSVTTYTIINIQQTKAIFEKTYILTINEHKPIFV